MTVNLAHTTFSPEDMRAFEPAIKIGLLATVNPDGLPHITLISSLKAGSPDTVTWGQFTEGLSKGNVHSNPRTAFLVMTLDKDTWRGKASWTHSRKEGPDFEWYNNIPMFRYNAYFGIHTVHYMDMIGHTGKQPLPMNRIITAAVQTMVSRTLFRVKEAKPVLNPWTRGFLDKLDNLKFLAYIDQDGYPWIIPTIQAQTENSQRIIYSLGAYGDELRAIPAGAPMALLGMALTMEDVLVRGVYQGTRTHAGMPFGTLQVDWVYNPMPPAPGQIYPETELRTVTEF